jgi:orotate phosphoribosyltransferase
MEAVVAIQAAGGDVIGLTSVFTYGFQLAEQVFGDAGIKTLSLSNYNSLIEVAVLKNIITENDVDLLKQWRENPSEWGR